jgi:hypothetical protein
MEYIHTDLDLLCNPSRLKERNIKNMASNKPTQVDNIAPKPNTKINTYTTSATPTTPTTQPEVNKKPLNKKSKNIKPDISSESDPEIEDDISNIDSSSRKSSSQEESDIETDISASIDTEDSIDLNTYLKNINKTYYKYDKCNNDEKQDISIQKHLRNKKSINSLITTITYLSNTLANIIKQSNTEEDEANCIYDKTKYYDDIIINEYRNCYVYSIKPYLGYSI